MALDMTTNYICKICKIEHDTYSGFLHHVRLGCSGDRLVNSKDFPKSLSKSFVCKLCKKEFENYSFLREHIKHSCNAQRHRRNLASKVGSKTSHQESSPKSTTVYCQLPSSPELKIVETYANQHKKSSLKRKTYFKAKVVKTELTAGGCIDHGETLNCDHDLKCQMTVHGGKENTDFDSVRSVSENLVSDKWICRSAKIYSVLPRSLGMPGSLSSSDSSDFKDLTTSKVQQQGKVYNVPSKGSVIDKVHADIKAVRREHMYVRCNLCEKVIKAVSLKSHLAIHNANGRFQCVECKKTFKLKSYLQSHMRNHAKESKYECGLCGQKYKNPTDLVDHMRRVHALENRFLCDICGKLFTCQKNFRFHMKTHSGERQIHPCDICGKNLKAAGTLKTHMHIHTGAKPYKCSICGHGFRQKTNLNNHYRIHTGEKLYKCYVCGKDLSNSESLKFHLNTHYGKKPYTCEICARGFAAPTNLRQHRKTHKSTM